MQGGGALGYSALIFEIDLGDVPIWWHIDGIYHIKDLTEKFQKKA